MVFDAQYVHEPCALMLLDFTPCLCVWWGWGICLTATAACVYFMLCVFIKFFSLSLYRVSLAHHAIIGVYFITLNIPEGIFSYPFNGGAYFGIWTRTYNKLSVLKVYLCGGVTTFIWSNAHTNHHTWWSERTHIILRRVFCNWFANICVCIFLLQSQ